MLLVADTNSGDIMRKLKKDTVFFAVGSISYGLIEILWRGHTHWAMLVAGGICFIIFSRVAEKFKSWPLLYKAIICALGVTAVELVFGIVFNIILKKNIWDYSRVPFNFLGQICLLYTVIWGILGLLFIPLADTMNKKLQK